MDQAGRRLPPAQREMERGADQIGVQRAPHRPADDPARKEVEDDGEIEPAVGGLEIGDVGGPDVIGRGRPKLALHQIRRHGHAWRLSVVTRKRRRGRARRPSARIKRMTRLRPTAWPWRAPRGGRADCRSGRRLVAWATRMACASPMSAWARVDAGGRATRSSRSARRPGRGTALESGRWPSPPR